MVERKMCAQSSCFLVSPSLEWHVLGCLNTSLMKSVIDILFHFYPISFLFDFIWVITSFPVLGYMVSLLSNFYHLCVIKSNSTINSSDWNEPSFAPGLELLWK